MSALTIFLFEWLSPAGYDMKVRKNYRFGESGQNFAYGKPPFSALSRVSWEVYQY